MSSILQQRYKVLASVPKALPSHRIATARSFLQPHALFRQNIRCEPGRNPATVRFRNSRRSASVVKAQAVVVTEAEKRANQERWKESGNSTGSVDEWQWTLNWDRIVEGITVGSCPRSPSDIDRLVDEGEVDAIVCLQCDDCLAALQVDMKAIRRRTVERGIAHVQVAIRDFDRQDQTRMLPEAARTVGLLRRLGHRVYVHCTAGINRAPLAVVGYLTFMEGMPLYDAVKFVKSRRSRANPYVECLKDARTQLLVAETKQVLRIAEDLYKSRRDRHAAEDGFADWVAAENLALKMLFERQLAASASLMTSMQHNHDAKQAVVNQELQNQSAAMLELQAKLQAQKQQVAAALADLQKAQQQLADLQKQCSSDCTAVDTAVGEGVHLDTKDQEISALKQLLMEVNEASCQALNDPTNA